MATEILKLDDKVGDHLRRSQIITQVSDIVRELVDNSIDAGAHSVQVLLDDYGLKKIQVKHTGHGIPADDIQFIITGGYTSKLNNLSHLSCDQQYGFRGEALAAICSFSDVIITTKTDKDDCASKYVLDNNGKIISKNRVTLGRGTNILIRNLFEKFPVRKNYIRQKTVCRRELKEIESYMKALGVANYKVYFSLYHNGNLIWSKPSVKSIEQSLTTVLGVNLARKLSKCPTVQLSQQQSEPGETDDDEPSHGWTGTMELFIPSPPVDMKLMGFTSSKMLMIFVNRRRVHIKEYEKLIKRYAVGGAEVPTQAEQRKFPIAVMMIEVPPSEVDFNRDMDKSKIFLTCRDLVRTKLEEALQSFYGINLNVIEEDANVASEESGTSVDMRGETMTKPKSLDTRSDLVQDLPRKNNHNNADNTESATTSSTKSHDSNFIQLLQPVPSTPEKRRENISFFMQDLPSQSHIGDPKPTGFPNKQIHLSTTSFTGPKYHLLEDKVVKNVMPPTIDISANENVTNQPSGVSHNKTPVANFMIDIDDINLDDVLTQLPASSTSNLMSAENNCFFDQVNSTVTPAFFINTALHENQMGSTPQGFYSKEQLQKLLDKSQESGSSSGAKPTQMTLSNSACPLSSIVVLNGFRNDVNSVNKSLPSGVNQFTRRPNPQSHTIPPPKKQKLFSTPTEVYQRGSRSAGGAGAGDKRKPRQITLESLKNWSITRTKSALPKHERAKLSKKCTSFQGNVSLEEIEINSLLIPHTLQYLCNKKTQPLEDDNNETRSPSSKSLVGFVATINLKSAVQNSMITRSTIPSLENNSPKVVSRLLGTNYFIVKVDGLLGIFNPFNVLELRPHLKYLVFENNNNKIEFEFSVESVVSLLEEFTKFASVLEEEQASVTFQVLTDLQSA